MKLLKQTLLNLLIICSAGTILGAGYSALTYVTPVCQNSNLTYKDLDLGPDYELAMGIDNSISIKGCDHDENLTPQKVAKDLDVLLYALDNAYIGKHELPANEYTMLIKDINNIKKNKSVTTVSALDDQINAAFSRVTDRHLSAGNILNMSLDGLVCNSKFYSVENKKIKNKNIIVIKISSFFMSNEEFMDMAAEIDSYNLLDSDGLVIDLRDNFGGDMQYVLQLMAGIKGYLIDFAKIAHKTSFVSSPECIIAQKNLIQHKSAHEKLAKNFDEAKHQQIMKLLDQSLETVLSQNEQLLTYDINESNIDRIYHDGYSKPIMILVNENSASSSELTTLLLKENHDQTLVVGNRTSGALKHVAPFMVKLPHSHIALMLPMMNIDFKKNINFKETVGIFPDILTDATLPVEDYIKKYMIDGYYSHLKNKDIVECSIENFDKYMKCRNNKNFKTLNVVFGQ